MSLLLWIGAGLLLWVVGGFASAARSSPSSLWFLIGTLGLGLCCCFLGVSGITDAPLGLTVWVRLLWSTLVLCVPAWVAFSYGFGRGGRAGPKSARRPIVVGFWLCALALLALGFVHPPVSYDPATHLFKLLDPVGRWVVLYSLVGVILALWNLHATLEAARAARKRRTASAVYALVPLLVTGIYLLADVLLYGEQGRGKTSLLIPAILVSMAAFVLVMGRRRASESATPLERPVVYSSIVLTALGLLFVTMAAVAQLMRLTGVTPGRWYEPAIAAGLILIFGLTIFPGMREEIRSFIDRNLHVSRFEYRTLWQRLNSALSGAGSIDDVAAALREFLRSIFGPIRMQLWVIDPDGRRFLPIGGERAPTLAADNPLVCEIQNRPGPLLISGDASRVRDIPLHVACEEMGQRFGLRVFLPIHASGSIVGILACGSGGGRVLHPEDIELLSTVTDHLAVILGVRGWIAPASTSSDSVGEVPDRSGESS
jgi:hypothetical protein